jgi:cytochrome oxidase Cu insertion factor (SCO1/SenC/PrrC family)
VIGRGVAVVLASLLLAASCGGDPEGPSLAEGDAAPDFTLPSAAGGEVTLSEFSGGKPVLLYFSMGPG